jgi:ribonuclease BN (tRNA processing enzyme)
MQDGHTWPKAVAQVASEAKVRKLVCTHFFPEIDNQETLAKMAEEVSANFGGEVYMAEDLMRVEV